jgi:heme-degrading monooxygenase HmoA
MIKEIAQIRIDPARASDFEAAVKQAAPAFKDADGCRAMSLERVVEDPALYRLVVLWDSVDHHMVTFQNSDGFKMWRGLAAPFFSEPPIVDHSQIVNTYF